MTRVFKAALAGLLFCLASCTAAPLPEPPAWMAEDGQAHFQKRVAEIAALPRADDATLLLGDSITEGWLWQAEQPGRAVLNHGVGWDVTEGLLARWPQYAEADADTVLIMIGTNDISYGRTPDQVVPPLREVLTRLKDAHPDARIILQSVLPREVDFRSRVGDLNAAYQALSNEMSMEWLDLTEAFRSPDGTLDPTLTDDGLHLNAKGYRVWLSQLRNQDVTIDG